MPTILFSMVDREYDINNMVRRVKTSLGDTLATYFYFADGEKHGVTTAPRYLYNGKEKQEFIHNTNSVLNAAGSATYTSNYIDYGARVYNPATLRWTTQDPLAEKYQHYSPYNYCVNSPINFVDPNGEAWRPTFERNTDGAVTWNGFEWIEESDSYNEEGLLKENLYHQAIFFSDNGTFNPSLKYNIGSSTATVYLSNGETITFNACTNPSDVKLYPTIPEGRYQAKLGIHHGSKNSYQALKMRDLNAVNQTIDIGGVNPAHPNRNYAVGINIHKAGQNDVTGMVNNNTVAISQGCILISLSEWNHFISLFNIPEQQNNVVGVIISRTLQIPTNKNKITNKLLKVNENLKGKAVLGGH